MCIQESIKHYYNTGRMKGRANGIAVNKGIKDGERELRNQLYQEPLNLKFKYLEGKEISRAIKEGERRACIGVIQNTGIFTCSILGVGFLLAPQVMTPTMIGVSIAVSTGAGVFAQKLLD